jgi:hypothetical protein
MSAGMSNLKFQKNHPLRKPIPALNVPASVACRVWRDENFIWPNPQPGQPDGQGQARIGEHGFPALDEISEKRISSGQKQALGADEIKID